MASNVSLVIGGKRLEGVGEDVVEEEGLDDAADAFGLENRSEVVLAEEGGKRIAAHVVVDDGDDVRFVGVPIEFVAVFRMFLHGIVHGKVLRDGLPGFAVVICNLVQRRLGHVACLDLPDGDIGIDGVVLDVDVSVLIGGLRLLDRESVLRDG